MRFGATRCGPSAPSTSQFGKYDAFTSMGAPGWSTSKSIESVPMWTFDSCAACAAVTGVVWPSATRGQDDGPSAATYTFHFHGSVYQVIAGPLAVIVVPSGFFGAVCGSLDP